MKTKLLTTLTGSALILALAACGGEEAPAPTPAPEDTSIESTEPVVEEPTEPVVEEPAVTSNTIVDVAAGNPDFSTLVAAINAAGLGETLAGEGPYTVFAPTNEAFAALPEGTLDTLLLPENKDQLVSILTYHVVPGRVMSSDLAGTTAEPATVNGATVMIDATGDSVMVGDATVTTADIEASNGVIHVIDQVILPSAE